MSGNCAPAGPGSLGPMSALSVVRAGLIGTAAVVLPGAAYGLAGVFSIRGAEPFFGLLGVTLALVGAMAWTCVRVARFRQGLAIVLTTLPFGAATLVVVGGMVLGGPSGASNAPAGLGIQAVILALAVGVAWASTRPAKQ